MARSKKVLHSNFIAVLVTASLLILAFEFVYFQKDRWADLLNNIPFLGQKTYDVAIELGEKKTNKIITSRGGEIVLEGEKGEGYKINFPQFSLLETVDINVQEVKSLQNLTKGTSFAFGIHIDSDLEGLVNPADLEISIPESEKGKKLVAYAYDKDGRDYHFYPAEIKEGRAVFKIYHFSGYGLLAVEDKYDEPPPPADMRNRAYAAIRGILDEIQSDISSNGGQPSADQKRRTINILDVWHRVKVKPLLEKAQGDDKIIMKAGEEYIVWWQSVLALEWIVGDEFDGKINDGQRLMASAVKNAADKASKKCRQEKDPAQAGVLTKLYALAHSLSLQGIQGIDTESIKTKALKCANFEVKLTSNNTLSSQGISWNEDGRGSLLLSIDEDFNLSGEGTVTGYYSGCVANPPEVYTVSIPKIKFGVSKKPEVTILFDTGPETNAVWHCPIGDIGEMTNPNDMWEFAFYQMHSDEYLGPGVGFLFKLSNWEILGKGNVYAKKEYNQTKSFTPPGGYSGYTVKEHTVFELIHKPK